MALKSLFLRKHLSNILFAVIIGVFLFVPAAKALVIQGLMEVGLFSPSIKPEVPDTASKPAMDLSGIRFKDASGKITDLGDLKGKVIFLNFWATWCPPCQAEMSSINKLYLQFKNDKNIVFLMVDADSELTKAAAYMQRKKFQLPVHAAVSSIPEQLFKGTLPTTIIFDKEGRISFQKEGAADYTDKKFVEFVGKLMAQ